MSSAAAAEARSETLRQEAANAEATADRLVARRAALGAEIDAANAQIATARARIAVISRRQRAQAALLGEANAPMLRLNALLQNMTREEVEAVIINVDRKSRSIQLSIKAKDAADESGAMSKLQADANASTGSTNLGALLKAKLSGSNE